MAKPQARTCHICEANCGILVELEGERVVSIKGDPEDVLSRGHVCPKATAIADLQTDPDRLRTPLKRVGADWVPIGWDQAGHSSVGSPIFFQREAVASGVQSACEVWA